MNVGEQFSKDRNCQKNFLLEFLLPFNLSRCLITFPTDNDPEVFGSASKLFGEGVKTKKNWKKSVFDIMRVLRVGGFNIKL